MQIVKNQPMRKSVNYTTGQVSVLDRNHSPLQRSELEDKYKPVQSQNVNKVTGLFQHQD
jgi:hypothetical protein